MRNLLCDLEIDREFCRLVRVLVTHHEVRQYFPGGVDDGSSDRLRLKNSSRFLTRDDSLMLVRSAIVPEFLAILRLQRQVDGEIDHLVAEPVVAETIADRLDIEMQLLVRLVA